MSINRELTCKLFFWRRQWACSAQQNTTHLRVLELHCQGAFFRTLASILLLGVFILWGNGAPWECSGGPGATHRDAGQAGPVILIFMRFWLAAKCVGHVGGNSWVVKSDEHPCPGTESCCSSLKLRANVFAELIMLGDPCVPEFLQLSYLPRSHVFEMWS